MEGFRMPTDVATRVPIRCTQRAPRSCTHCAARKISCSKTIPCLRCIGHHREADCRREIVVVSDCVVNDDPVSQGYGCGTIVSDFLSRQDAYGCAAYNNVEWPHAFPMSPLAQEISAFLPTVANSENDFAPAFATPINYWTPTDSLDKFLPPALPRNIPSTPSRPVHAYLRWHALENLMVDGQNMLLPHTDFDTLREEDIAINIVCKGWEYVERFPLLDTQWMIIREVDQGLLTYLPEPSRLAALLFTRMVMGFPAIMTYGSPGRRASMPFLAYPTPSQLHNFHSPAVDFFICVRERLLADPNRYCNSRFLHDCLKHYRFTWPHDIEFAYEMNSIFGTLQLSPEFKRSLHKITCHAMKEEFFELWGEFSGEIPRLGLSMSSTQLSENRPCNIKAQDCAYPNELPSTVMSRSPRNSFL